MSKHLSWNSMPADAALPLFDPAIYKLMVESAPVIILILDTRGAIQYVNPYFEELTGYRFAEVQGKEWFSTFLPPRDHDRIRALFQTAIGDMPTRGNINPIVTRSGEEREIEWSDRVVCDAQGNITSIIAIGQDVTARKRSEEALRSREMLLNEAQRIAHVGSWELDLVTGELIWSDEIFRLFEIDKNEFGATYAAFLDAVHPDDRERVNQAYTNSLATRMPYEVVHRLRMNDGRIKWVEERCVSDFDADGKPLRSRGTVQDITERKLAEDEIAAAKRKLEATLAAVPDLMFEVGLDGRYYDYHSPRTELLAAGPEELMGRRVADILPPDAAAVAMAALREAHETGRSQGEQYELQLPQGRHWFELSIARKALDPGEEPRFIVLARDITERKQAEASLHDAQRLLDSIIENIPAMVFVKSAQDLSFERFNRAAETLLGYSRGDMLGKNDYDFFPKEQADFFVAKDRKVLASDGIVEIPEEPIRDARGETHYLHTWKIALRDDVGVSKYLLGISIDITGRKQAEEALRKSNACMRAILDNSPYMTWLKDKDGRYVNVNSRYVSYARATDAKEIVGKTDFELWPQALAEKYQAADIEVMTTRKQKYIEELSMDGDRLHWVENVKTPVLDENGDVLGTTGFARDITERKLAEEQVRNWAFYDSLTSLPNRRLLNDRLIQAIAVSNRSGCYGALMFIDLDDFKLLNDTHGHDAGDMLLVEVAQRISHCVREADTVARFAGDEFVVMLAELDSDKNSAVMQAKVVAEKLRATLEDSYVLRLHGDGNTAYAVKYRCTCSIGVALFHAHDVSQEDLLRLADKAMYQAKNAGRNAVCFFGAEM